MMGVTFSAKRTGAGSSQMELFDDGGEEKPTDSAFITPALLEIFELSVEAFYSALYASMSELPIKREISRFMEKVSKTGDRIAADRAASDRGDPDVLAVLSAAGKVRHEIHRLTGLLRFSPGPDGVYIARCAPDFFVLPALAEHFTLRFGNTSWAIIDEKRKLCLCREKDGDARIIDLPPELPPVLPPDLSAANNKDPWEDLWRLYHKSVNNEARNNPRLQCQFIPGRYKKYLCEFKSNGVL